MITHVMSLPFVSVYCSARSACCPLSLTPCVLPSFSSAGLTCSTLTYHVSDRVALHSSAKCCRHLCTFLLFSSSHTLPSPVSCTFISRLSAFTLLSAPVHPLRLVHPSSLGLGPLPPHLSLARRCRFLMILFLQFPYLVCPALSPSPFLSSRLSSTNSSVPPALILKLLYEDLDIPGGRGGDNKKSNRALKYSLENSRVGSETIASSGLLMRRPLRVIRPVAILLVMVVCMRV